MALSYEEIRKEISEPRRRTDISLALLHQQRIRFHASTRLTADYMQPTADFFAFVQNLLPHDKFKIFKQLFRYPVKTNELCDTIFDKLSRIFDGRNPAFDYQFKSTTQRDDWDWYRTERLHEPQVWQTKGWEFFKTEINSVLVCDMPEEQRGDDRYPQPYFYWLPIASVISFDAHADGQMRWIIFRQDGDRIAVMDDETMRVFRKDAGENIGVLLSEQRHGLGYCPARFFWQQPIDMHTPNVKASPLTKMLDALDWFLFYSISKRHLDLYGSYPIYSGYEQACDYSNEENGDYCDGGYLKDKQGRYMFDSAGMLLPCPKCGQKRIIGAGSFVEIPVPADGQPDLRNPVQMLAVDRNSLEYNRAEEERLREGIITSVCGQAEEVTQRDALNEQQIKANFESQSNVLNRIKKGFESAQKWVDETICRLRYGDMFVSASINYGTEFFLYTTAEMRDAYKLAKEAGSSEAELDAMLDKIIESEYRTNPTEMQRMQTLADLEPYRHLTLDEVVQMGDRGIITREDVLLKLNFAALVKRFERENMNILEFGSALPYPRKIEIINQALRGYIASEAQNLQGNAD